MVNIPFEMPREKLFRVSSTSFLSNQELLVLILKTGTKDISVFDLAKKCLNKYSIKELSNRSLKELMNIKGISLAKASTLLAAFELSKRATIEKKEIKKISSSKDIYSLLSPNMSILPNEKVKIVLVNSKCEVIRTVDISQGGVHFSFFDIQKIIKTCLDYHVHGFFLIHNHPSGHTKPSIEDISVTKKIKEASKLLNLAFLDHIIIGKNNYYSFYDDDNL